MNYYNEIKTELINNEITKKIKDYSKNKSDLTTYYNVGKLLSEAGKHYGEGIIKNYSQKLKNEINKKYNETNLKRMRQFYLKVEKGATLWHQLSWSHYKLLLPLKSIEEINYYVKTAVNNLYSVRQLEEKIKSKEYERLAEETKNKLITNEKSNVKDLIKNPIIINNKNNYKIISEKVLQKIILEDIDNFLDELGNGFCYIKNEYKIKLGDRYYYIDLLLYNIEFNCYTIVELKITELKKEYIGQIQTYMNYIDKNIKRIDQDKTIGIIVCKKNNKFIMEYCSDDRILTKEYNLV
ncbi:MAG: DUF1016 family protein [Bacilli bacterium]|nr:DUF1016 family protein [Bacilli bacterium]